MRPEVHSPDDIRPPDRHSDVMIRWVGGLATALSMLGACGESASDGGSRGGSAGTGATEAGVDAGGGTSGAGGATDATADTPCTSDDECFGATSHCDVGAGVCTGCASDEDCRGELRCDTATGICRDCVTDAHCEDPRPICDAVSRQCTARCSTIGDCLGTGGPSVCDVDRGVCVDCVPSALLCTCETETFSCVGCIEDADCPASAPYCGPSHECSPECDDDQGCPGGLRCDATSRRCVECAKNAHCPGETCQVDHTCG